MDMDIPVTLVIKAPNQKYDDQTINCFLNWTVEKLKTHLSHVYPSKPSSKDQRLVYSGKLLSDHLQLKDVLRKQDEYHMVHLVCSSRTPPGSPQLRKRCIKSKSHANSDTCPVGTESTGNAAPPSVGQSHATGQHAAGQSQQGHFINTTNHPAFVQGVPWNQFTLVAGPPSGTALPISPMSLLWWQQVYIWQLYMHYHASLAMYYHTARPVPTNSQSEQPGQGQAAPADLVGGEGQDEEDQNRDWLDWVYTGSRAIVLLSIVYFYSSFSRFVMVVGGMLLLYLHQAGWLPFNLENELQNLADGGNQDELDGDLNDLQDMERVMDDGLGDEDGDSGEEDGEGPPGDDESGFLSSAWSFITTFFTSLIPEGLPNAAN